MKLYLKTYSREASAILYQAMYWWLNSEWSHEIRRAPDNELVYIDDKHEDPPDVVRKRLAEVLKTYMTCELKYKRHSENPNVEGEKAACLRLIVLEKDKQAVEEFPEVYDFVKGKPLDPIRNSAVTTLLAQIKRAEREEKKELWKQVHKMRGFEYYDSDICNSLLLDCI